MSDHDTPPESPVPAALSLAELQAKIKALEAELAQVRDERNALWQQRQAGTRDRNVYIDFFMCEDRMMLINRDLDELRPRLVYAEKYAGGMGGKARFDAYCPIVKARALAVCEALDAVLKASQDFVTARNEQIDPLVVLRTPDNHAAFELRDGLSQLQDMIQVIPNAAALVKDWLVWSILQPHAIDPEGHPAVGLAEGDCQRVLAQATGTIPFPAGEMARYLAQFEVKDQKPDTPMEDL